MKVAVQTARMYTSTTDCGSFLTKGLVYYITGRVNEGRMDTEQFDLNADEDNLTAEEKKFFDDGYRQVQCQKAW